MILKPITRVTSGHVPVSFFFWSLLSASVSVGMGMSVRMGVASCDTGWHGSIHCTQANKCIFVRGHRICKVDFIRGNAAGVSRVINHILRWGWVRETRRELRPGEPCKKQQLESHDCSCRMKRVEQKVGSSRSCRENRLMYYYA